MFGNAFQFDLLGGSVRHVLGLPARRIHYFVADWPEHTGKLFAVFALVAYCLSTLSSYALLVFPKLEPTFGGGAPVIVTVAPKPSGLPHFEAFGMRPGADGLIGPLDLIAETADGFVVSLRRDSDEPTLAASIRLPRSAVGALMSAGSEIGFPGRRSATSTPTSIFQTTPTPSPTAALQAPPGRN